MDGSAYLNRYWSRVDGDSVFQVAWPDTAKLQRPSVVPLFTATLKSPWVTERKLARPWCIDTGTHSSVRYTGAVWCVALHTRSQSLYSILSWIGSQCSTSRMVAVIGSYLPFLRLVAPLHSVLIVAGENESLRPDWKHCCSSQFDLLWTHWLVYCCCYIELSLFLSKHPNCHWLRDQTPLFSVYHSL